MCTCLQRPEVNLWIVSWELATLFSKTRSLMGLSHWTRLASQWVSGVHSQNCNYKFLLSCYHHATINHATVMILSCYRRAIIMIPSCHHHATVTLLSCYHHAAVTLSSCYHHATVMLSSCCHHATMLSFLLFFCSYSSGPPCMRGRLLLTHLHAGLTSSHLFMHYRTCSGHWVRCCWHPPHLLMVVSLLKSQSCYHYVQNAKWLQVTLP